MGSKGSKMKEKDEWGVDLEWLVESIGEVEEWLRKGVEKEKVLSGLMSVKEEVEKWLREEEEGEWYIMRIS